MPWFEQTVTKQRRDLVDRLATGAEPVARLARAYGVSRKTAYKWRDRFRADPEHGLEDRSRRPHHSPGATDEELVQRILAFRRQYPFWGARKLRRLLIDAGYLHPPAASTINGILGRAGLLDPALARRPYQRFEAQAPNDLWQMDFKGPIHLEAGTGSVLSVLDDHSRFSLHLGAYPNQQGETVKAALIRVFDTFGLPQSMLVDNGSPWGNSLATPYTPLAVWLLHVGVGVKHGRPYHPQTQGKVERFNGTMERELLKELSFTDLADCCARLEEFRRFYNESRPHEALGYDRPVQRYTPSPRPYPGTLRPIEYDSSFAVRRVQHMGVISFEGREFRLPKAFRGYAVGLREAEEDGAWDVYFLEHHIGQITLAGDVK